jgi:hypothetical protein
VSSVKYARDLLLARTNDTVLAAHEMVYAMIELGSSSLIKTELPGRE